MFGRQGVLCAAAMGKSMLCRHDGLVRVSLRRGTRSSSFHPERKVGLNISI